MKYYLIIIFVFGIVLKQLAQTIEREFGRLDGLLHCAVESGTLTPLELYETEMWYRVMQT